MSRVVNRSPKVSDEIRRSVDLAISELGYVPNPAARSLVTRRSDSVAVVITEPSVKLFDDPFFPRLLRGISAELNTRELQLVLLMPGSTREEERVRNYLGAGHVDGALLVSLHGDDPLPDWLAERGSRSSSAAGRHAAPRSATSTWTTARAPGPRSST